GAGGMAISIGKLSLYSVGAGIQPSLTLPICLDVGTDNMALLGDPLYLGSKRRRITGDDYSAFIEKFVEGVKRNFPDAVLQWEDFSKSNAYNNLDRYRKKLVSFNDDVQGTGAVVLGGIFGAMKIKGQKLKEQKFVIYGAGAAGIGISRQLLGGMMGEGLSRQDALDTIFVVDSAGLLVEGRQARIDDYKKDFAKPRRVVSGWPQGKDGSWSLEDTIKHSGVTALIGVSGRARAFDDTVVNLMMQNSSEPVIFPLSNPTSKAEADPRWIVEYTKGAAIVSSGSPFPPVTVQGREYRIGQGNNAFIFPGLGLGLLAASTKEVTDSLFTAAADALAQTILESDIKSRCVYPNIENLFDVSFNVALAVYKKSVEEGSGKEDEGKSPEEAVRSRMWLPDYPLLAAKKREA
ncbi:MAG: oxaloacetate-decarboxylating malate dehydrogenase, partial [Nitrospinota bacterium]